MGEASNQGIGGEEWVEQTVLSPLFLASLWFRPYLPSLVTLTRPGLSDPPSSRVFLWFPCLVLHATFQTLFPLHFYARLGDSHLRMTFVASVKRF